MLFGADEVGRGCFAGPVVAGCVCFSVEKLRSLRRRRVRSGWEFGLDGEFVYVNDSKKMTEKQRDLAEVWIRKNSDTWGLGEGGVGMINRSGIVKEDLILFYFFF